MVYNVVTALCMLGMMDRLHRPVAKWLQVSRHLTSITYWFDVAKLTLTLNFNSISVHKYYCSIVT